MDVQMWFICLYSKENPTVSIPWCHINFTERQHQFDFSDIVHSPSSSSFYSGDHTVEIITTIMVQRQLENYHHLSASTAVIDLETDTQTHRV